MTKSVIVEKATTWSEEDAETTEEEATSILPQCAPTCGVRYGSVPRLVDELTAIRLGIAGADPSVEQSAEPKAQEYSLAATGQALATILRLATIASERHLPLLTTG